MYATPTRCVGPERGDPGHRGRRGPRHATPARFGHDPAAQPPCVIALIDPKPLTRQSLLEMLGGSLGPGIRLLGASDSDQVFGSDAAGPSSNSSSLRSVLIYIRSVGITNSWVQEQLRSIRTQAPGVAVIIISDRDDSEDVFTALDHGVRGYITTSNGAEVAIAALKLIDAGERYVPAHALRSDGIEPAFDASDIVPPSFSLQLEKPEPPRVINLTARELAVIRLLQKGNPNKVIASTLDMAEATVKVHVRNILKKLRVTNRTHAAMVANRLLVQSNGPVLQHDEPSEFAH